MGIRGGPAEKDILRQPNSLPQIGPQSQSHLPPIPTQFAGLERAGRRGEVRDDVDLGVVLDLVWGAAFARYVSGVGGEEGFVDGVMDAVWRGIEGTKDESEV